MDENNEGSTQNHSGVALYYAALFDEMALMNPTVFPTKRIKRISSG